MNQLNVKNMNPMIPSYWNLLSYEDKINYLTLQKKFSTSDLKSKRNKSNSAFIETLDILKKFIIRNDQNDLKRALVCGIVWLKNGIAINTHQLSLLINKCKSSINGSFQSLGYGTIPTGCGTSNELITIFPFMRTNFAELRQWTMRMKIIQKNYNRIDEINSCNADNDAKSKEEESGSMKLSDLVRELLSKTSQNNFHTSISAPPQPIRPQINLQKPQINVNEDPLTFCSSEEFPSNFNFDFD